MAPRFVGPFKVIELINEVTARLQLPKTLRKIHAVFHTSMLKKAPLPDQWHPEPATPKTVVVGGEQHHEIRGILDSRWHRKRLQYLIEWEHFSKGEREWVEKRHLCAPKLV